MGRTTMCRLHGNWQALLVKVKALLVKMYLGLGVAAEARYWAVSSPFNGMSLLAHPYLFPYPQAALEGHRQAVTSLAFAPRSSPAGPHLLASAADCVRLWDAAAGAAKGALTDHIFPVVAVAFTPDGAMLLSADTSHTVRLWAVAAAGSAAAPPPRPASVRGRGAPFGAAAAAASGTAGFKQLAVMETESSGHLTAMAISPDGRVVATGSAAGELHIFAMGAGGTAGDGTAGGGGGVSTVHAAHAGPVRHVAFSPSDPRALVSSSDDCTLRLWDTRTALKQQGGAGEATVGARRR